MFDIGWTELLLIGIVALIVVGPKDLPRMFHTLGRFTAKAKAMAREFQDSMDEAAREAGVDDIASDLRKATSTKSLGLDKLSEAADKFEKWEPGSPTAKRAGERAEAGAKTLEAEAKPTGKATPAAKKTRSKAKAPAKARAKAKSPTKAAKKPPAKATTARPKASATKPGTRSKRKPSSGPAS